MRDLSKHAITLRLMELLWENGSWCGETHLQKSMFFLEKLGQAPTDFKFILYKHGPYSFDFHDHLSELRSLGLVELEIIPPYGPRHRPTERGRELIKKWNDSLSTTESAIKVTAQCLGGKKIKELEKLGTALLVQEEMPNADVDTRASRLHEYKPHIPLFQAREATVAYDGLIPCFREGCPA